MSAAATAPSKHDALLGHVLHLLALAGVSSDALWQGAPVALPLLAHFRHDLLKGAPLSPSARVPVLPSGV